jgi:hypothetical protein
VYGEVNETEVPLTVTRERVYPVLAEKVNDRLSPALTLTAPLGLILELASAEAVMVYLIGWAYATSIEFMDRNKLIARTLTIKAALMKGIALTIFLIFYK